MPYQRIMIVTTVPEAAVEAVLDAVSAAGGGVIGGYSHCAFTNEGVGRFKPGADANPHLGDVGVINAVEEVRIETFCDRAAARAVLAALRAAHPYEEPVIHIIPLLDEDEL